MSRNWTPDQLVLAFDFYTRTPFGKFHQHNPDVIELAEAIGRTPSAVAMKCGNFASLDPAEQARGVSGLGNASAADKETFSSYAHDLVRLATDAIAAAERIGGQAVTLPEIADLRAPRDGETEAQATITIRRGQVAFRRAVLAAYDERCAVCAINLRDLLWAGHIVPWAALKEKRLDPTNGICFCVLHERAFDLGYFTIDESMTIDTAPTVARDEPPPVHAAALIDIKGAALTMPRRFAPDPAALKYHREHIFSAA